MRQFPRWWGWPLEIFSPEAPSKIGELLKTNSCSLQQATSCFTFCRCFKAKTIVSIDDLYLRSAECFFHGLHGSLCNTFVVHSLINLVIYLLLCYTIYCGIHLPRIQTSSLSLSVHHQSLASTLRKTKRLRKRLDIHYHVVMF